MAKEREKGHTVIQGTGLWPGSVPAHSPTHTHRCPCTCKHIPIHTHTQECTHIHTPCPASGGPPNIQTLQLSIPSLPLSLPSLHRRHLANLRKGGLQGHPISLLVCSDWGPQAICFPGSLNPQRLALQLPRPPGSCTHHCHSPSPGPGPVSAAPSLSLAPSLQASASPWTQWPGPRQTLPLAEQLQLAEQKGRLCFTSQAELAVS